MGCCVAKNVAVVDPSDKTEIKSSSGSLHDGPAPVAVEQEAAPLTAGSNEVLRTSEEEEAVVVSLLSRLGWSVPSKFGGTMRPADFDDVIRNKLPRVASPRPGSMRARRSGSASPSGSGGAFRFDGTAVDIVVDELPALQQRPEPIPRPILRPKPQQKEILNWRVRSLLGHSSLVTCAALAPGEKQCVSCGYADTTITTFDTNTGCPRGEYRGHFDTVVNAAFSPDRKLLATASRDQSVILWDAATARPQFTFVHAHVATCACFSPNSRWLVTACLDNTCRVWDARRGKELVSFTGHTRAVAALCFSPDGIHVASASSDCTVRVWVAATGRGSLVLAGHDRPVLSCSYTSNGTTLVTHDGKQLRTWDTRSGKCLRVFDAAAVLHDARMSWTACAAAPGQFTKYIVAAASNRSVCVLDADTGMEVLSIRTRAIVYALTVGSERSILYGDSLGNVSLLHLE